MTQRRAVLWFPFSEGATPTTLAASTLNRLFLPSIRETEVGREYEGYTVTRIILRLTIFSDGGTEQVITCGIIAQQEDVAIASVSPVGDPTADWMWHEEFVLKNSGDLESMLITRDLGSQRRLRGAGTELYWYAENRDAADAVKIHRSGRVLIKRA